LARCLDALDAQADAPPFEIVVVDAAHDDAVAATAAGRRRVRLVRSCVGLRAGEARNLGVAQARGQILAFTDADCLPEPGWLRAAAAALADGVRLAGGPVTDALPRHAVAVADNLLQFVDFPAERPATPQDHFPGCNLAMRRADFLAAGGFRHPGGQLAGEDVVLCADVTARWPGATRFVPAMAVRHAGRSGLVAYLRHQHDFGYARGALGLRLKPVHRSLGRWRIMLGPIVLKRLCYIAERSFRWRGSAALLTVALLSPLLLGGLVAWAIGFRRGLLAQEQPPAGRTTPHPDPAPQGGREEQRSRG
jgi:glycosyltransferase involved in cell wall biosynthesis